MCGKIGSFIVVIIALAMAIAASVIKPESIDSIIRISRFFDVMLPVLAVGALIKYLCHGGIHRHCNTCQCHSHKSNCHQKHDNNHKDNNHKSNLKSL